MNLVGAPCSVIEVAEKVQQYGFIGRFLLGDVTIRDAQREQSHSNSNASQLSSMHAYMRACACVRQEPLSRVTIDHNHEVHQCFTSQSLMHHRHRSGCNRSRFGRRKSWPQPQSPLQQLHTKTIFIVAFSVSTKENFIQLNSHDCTLRR